MTIAQLNDLGQTIFEQRYAYPGEKTWRDRAKSVALHVASAESDKDKESVCKRFYDAIASGDFIPGGRILFGSGRKDYNLLNCYVLQPGDSVASIGKLIQDTYRISCAGGGIGFNFSKIRPRGDDIQNISNSAPGSVSVMRMINEIGNHVRAGKNRRTALIGILDVTHPDLLDFLHVKLDKKELTNFNISVAVTDRFLEACENNENWYFTFNNRKYYIYSFNRVSKEGIDLVNVIGLNEEDAHERAVQHYSAGVGNTFNFVREVPLKAKELWNQIWGNAVESGDPGIYNISLANKYTNVSYFETLDSTNPCGEIPLPNFGNCCLGHINLSNMVEDGEFDWKRFAASVRTGIRFLDNVLTVNSFPIEECREVAHKSRRIGLGVLGYHYMLIKLGIKYGSDKCLEFTDRLMSTFRDEAYKTSIYMSRDKGPFEEFNASKYLKEEYARTLPARIRMLIREHGIRNAVMLTVAPTGTISMVHGVSSGVEPIFAAMYKRRYRENNSWQETVVVDPLFREYYEKEMSLEDFVGAYDVPPKQHMAVQAVCQRYIDSSISKTINLPSSATAEELSNTALAFAPYLKGLTVYRAGSKGQEPLEAIPLNEENIHIYMGVESVIEEEVQDATFCSINGGDCG
jgi:ribonucleoside-diphosphate reductase alpha chain